MVVAAGFIITGNILASLVLGQLVGALVTALSRAGIFEPAIVSASGEPRLIRPWFYMIGPLSAALASMAFAGLGGLPPTGILTTVGVAFTMSLYDGARYRRFLLRDYRQVLKVDLILLAGVTLCVLSSLLNHTVSYPLLVGAVLFVLTWKLWLGGSTAPYAASRHIVTLGRLQLPEQFLGMLLTYLPVGIAGAGSASLLVATRYLQTMVGPLNTLQSSMAAGLLASEYAGTSNSKLRSQAVRQARLVAGISLIVLLVINSFVHLGGSWMHLPEGVNVTSLLVILSLAAFATGLVGPLIVAIRVAGRQAAALKVRLVVGASVVLAVAATASAGANAMLIAWVTSMVIVSTTLWSLAFRNVYRDAS